METGERRQVTLTDAMCAAYARAHAEYCQTLETYCGARNRLSARKTRTCRLKI